MTNKICICCNKVINKGENFEEYLNSITTKVLRNRKYSGLWIHKKCPPYKKDKENKEKNENENENENEKYYNSLIIFYHKKKKYLINEKNNIIYHYRASPNTFNKKEVSEKIRNEIEIKKKVEKIKNIIKKLEKANNDTIDIIIKEFKNIKYDVQKDKLLLNKIQSVLYFLYFSKNIIKIKDIFKDIFKKDINKIELDENSIYVNPLNYIEKISKTPFFDIIKNKFFDKDDKISNIQIKDMDNFYRSQIIDILKKRYSYKTILYNTVVLQNKKDKPEYKKYYATILVLSECNCSYSKEIHYIKERHIFYFDYSTYLNSKLENDHTIDLILSNKIECNKDIIKENDKCPLCYTEYNIGQKLIKLKCNHLFCDDDECLKEWFNIKKICPYCNQSL